MSAVSLIHMAFPVEVSDSWHSAVKFSYFICEVLEVRNTTSKRQRSYESLLFPLSILVVFFQGFAAGGFQLVLIDIGATFGLNNTMMGTVVTSQFIALTLAVLIVGRHSDKIGKKRVLIIFMPILIVGSGFAIVAGSSLMFMASVFLVGTGGGICECMLTAAVSDNEPARAEKRINTVQAFFSGGALTGPVVFNFLMSSGFTWRIVYVLPAICFILLFPMLLLTRFTVKSPNLTAEPASAPKVVNPLKFFSSKVFVIIFLSMIIYSGLEVGVSFFADSFLTVELEAPDFGSIAISVYWLSMTVSRLLFSWIKTEALRVSFLLFGVLTIPLVVLSLNTSVPFALVLYAVIGFLMGPVWCLLIAYATKTYINQSGGVASLMVAAGGLGAAAFPVAFGAIADAFDLRISIIMLALSTLLIFLVGGGHILKKKLGYVLDE